MKTVQRLVEAEGNKKLGNHRVNYYNHYTREFIYYATAIVVVDDTRRIFYTDNGGWGTQSTTRAINAYRREFSYYKEVTKAEFEQITSADQLVAAGRG